MADEPHRFLADLIIGCEAARSLLERVEDLNRNPQQPILATRLVVRASTAPPGH